MESALFPFTEPAQQILASSRLSGLKRRALVQMEAVQAEFDQLKPEDFHLSIAKKRVGLTNQYYWRLNRTVSKNRKFTRLSDPDLVTFLKPFEYDFKVQLLRLESSIVNVNATLKYCAITKALITEYSEIDHDLILTHTML